jgi:Dolichyl-phosphate-mannose-protein mannosyltransferase
MPNEPSAPPAVGAGRLARSTPWILAAAVLVFYGRALVRPFTSEDYLLIRFLGEHPPWRDLWAQLAEPWLGITAVRFWRPVSTFLYGLEIAAFGGSPYGYNLVHLLVHLLNTLLAWAIVRRLAGAGLVPLAAALLFALYPLHPNAVVFSASFATIFAAAFLLGGFLAWLRFREEGSIAGWWIALGLFGLALGSYEAAAVFPAVLVAHDHLLVTRRRHLAMVPPYLPFFAVLGGYLLLRRQVFGVFVGGYEEYSQRLTAPQVKQTLLDLVMSIHQIHVPVYDRWPGPWTLAVTCTLVILLPVVLFVARRRSLDPLLSRLWLFAWAWALAFQAPFAFKPSVPGNGRYWYLAALGVALAVAVLARAFPVRALAPAALALFGAFWAFLLIGYVGAYMEAGRTARAIQTALIQARADRIFLTRYPYFVMNEVGVPIAQVYHYGLRDAVHPPFTDAAVPVWPLPPLQGTELLPVALGAPRAGVYEWDGATVRPAAIPRPDPGLVELQVLSFGRGGVQVAVPQDLHRRFRLLVVARGNAAIFDLGPESVANGILRADLPDPFFQTMERLYPGGEFFWWIEARDEAGRITGFTRMRQNRSVSPIM